MRHMKQPTKIDETENVDDETENVNTVLNVPLSLPPKQFDPEVLLRQIRKENPLADIASVKESAIVRAAKLVREARLTSQLSQRELAKRAGVKQSAISRLESGVGLATRSNDGTRMKVQDTRIEGPTIAYLAGLLHACGYYFDFNIRPLEKDT